MLKYEGRTRHSVNYLKAMQFDRPEWMPCSVSLMSATWTKYGDELKEIVLAHPRIFPDFDGDASKGAGCGDIMSEVGRKTDCWGTVWDNVAAGLSSHPVEFPLEDWDDLDAYDLPDSMAVEEYGPRDWDAVAESLRKAKENGGIARGGGLMHGFMYMRLFYLRRFENLMMDMAVDDPRLPGLVAMVESFNAPVIEKYLELGTELIALGDDLGLQDSLPMGPTLWRKWIGPSYTRLFAPCRERNVPVYLHTDGHILEIIPDLIAAGVRVLNPQIRANGLEGLRQMAKGVVCIDLDLDRQLFPFATPSEIEDHIGAMYEGLRSDDGGLMLHAECEPDVPLENIETILATLEKTCNPPEPE